MRFRGFLRKDIIKRRDNSLNNSEKQKNDRYYMSMAVELAARGGGYTHPNPLVGAVIVKNGRIIGKGYHEIYGSLHAERSALASCAEDPAGSVIYVTLEPCCHYGKQPPCTRAIIDSGISKVVIGSRDPNPLVSGKGVSILREAGIEVVTDFMREECDKLNPVFFKFINTGKPFVTMKYAMTADGKIATYSGKSKWITGAPARRRVHLDRGLNTAIMVGIGTVLADDPELTCRDAEGLDPVRIICDTRLRTPLDAKVVQTAQKSADPQGDGSGTEITFDDCSRYPRTIIATAVTDEEKLKPYRDQDVVILNVRTDADGHIDLNELMTRLGEMKIDSIFLEGGAELNWTALDSGIVDKVQTYIAPKIFGGRDAKTPVAGTGTEAPPDAVMLKNTTITTIGEDILLESEVCHVHGNH